MSRKSIVSCMLRTRTELWEKVREAAAINDRSVNAEITTRLEQSFGLEKVNLLNAAITAFTAAGWEVRGPILPQNQQWRNVSFAAVNESYRQIAGHIASYRANEPFEGS